MRTSLTPYRYFGLGPGGPPGTPGGGIDDVAALTVSLLAAYERKRFQDSIFGMADAYAKLGHPGLAAQLRQVILDSTKNFVTRRATITIAEMCV